MNPICAQVDQASATLMLTRVLAIRLAPAPWWVTVNASRGVPDMQAAFASVFGQGLWTIGGSITAFLVSQLIDVAVFQVDPSGLPVLPLSKDRPEALRGAHVLVLGYPAQREFRLRPQGNSPGLYVTRSPATSAVDRVNVVGADRRRDARRGRDRVGVERAGMADLLAARLGGGGEVQQVQDVLPPAHRGQPLARRPAKPAPPLVRR